MEDKKSKSNNKKSKKVKEGKYFKKVDGNYEATKRPDNQSNKGVLKKIAIRQKKLEESDPLLERTNIQDIFIKQQKKSEKTGKSFLQKNNLAIAHDISINQIQDELVIRVNNPELTPTGYTEEFVDAIITTEDDNSNQKLKENFKKFRDKSIDTEEKLGILDQTAHRLNPTSKNVKAGDSSKNSGIGCSRDINVIHKNIDGEKILVQTPVSKKIARVVDKAFHNNEKYKPKEDEMGRIKTSAIVDSEGYHKVKNFVLDDSDDSSLSELTEDNHFTEDDEEENSNSFSGVISGEENEDDNEKDEKNSSSPGLGHSSDD